MKDVAIKLVRKVCPPSPLANGRADTPNRQGAPPLPGGGGVFEEGQVFDLPLRVGGSAVPGTNPPRCRHLPGTNSLRNCHLPHPGGVLCSS
jgi:hypothetical protein